MKDLGVTSSPKESSLDNYVFGKAIGEGGNGKVWLARHLLSGQEVALKFIRKWSQDSLEYLYREVSSMRALDHPHIMRLHEVIETREYLILVMDYIKGGDLADYLEAYGPLEELEARQKFRQLVSAVQYLHTKGIAHRDLKPENILVDEDHMLKLADFGSSKCFLGHSLMSLCGTATYMAPEVLDEDIYGPEVDVWSLGFILYKMVTGSLPLEDGHFHKQHMHGIHLPLLDMLSPELGHLLMSMIHTDPGKRATLDTIMQHPWVNFQMDELTPYIENTESAQADSQGPTPCDLHSQKVSKEKGVFSCPLALASIPCNVGNQQADETQEQGTNSLSKCTSLPSNWKIPQASLQSSRRINSYYLTDSLFRECSLQTTLSTEDSSPSAAHGQCQQGKARKLVRFIQKMFCCGVSSKRNKCTP